MVIWSFNFSISSGVKSSNLYGLDCLSSELAFLSAFGGGAVAGGKMANARYGPFGLSFIGLKPFVLSCSPCIVNTLYGAEGGRAEGGRAEGDKAEGDKTEGDRAMGSFSTGSFSTVLGGIGGEGKPVGDTGAAKKGGKISCVLVSNGG